MGHQQTSLPETMQVVEISRPGGADVLVMSKRALPVPGHGEVLIALDYAGINRPDALQRAGLYNPPKGASDLPGLEGAGRVVALGPGVASLQVGDEVCALLPGGGYAQYATTAASHCLPVPAGFSLKQAAALPETFFTVYSNVVMRGGLRAGERFLVHGGSSGIGTTAIQMAHAMGARVFATAGSAEKCATCLELGADRSINYRETDFVEVLRAEGGADLILDMVGGDYIPRNIRALADDGRLVQIAFLQGAKVELNFAQIMTRRLSVTGSTLRPQSVLAKTRIADALHANIWPLLEAGTIMPVIDSEFSLEEAAKAHELMESSRHIGKIVLRI